MKTAAILLATVVATNAAVAQTDGFRWSLSAGPTWCTRARTGDILRNGCADSYGIAFDDRNITSAEHQVFNATLGASRRWAGSATTVRSELMYNRAGSDGTLRRYPYDSMNVYQAAPREEMLAANVGLQWDAFPTRRVSPYLLTAIGGGRIWMSWNSDTTSKRLDRRNFREFMAVQLGFGLRAQIGKHEAFVEWRRFDALPVDPPRIAPFSLGIRF